MKFKVFKNFLYCHLRIIVVVEIPKEAQNPKAQMLTTFVLSARDTIHEVFRPKPLPPVKVPCLTMSNKEMFCNFIFFSAAILAPLYYTVLRDALRKIRSVNYKIVRVRN